MKKNLLQWMWLFLIPMLAIVAVAQNAPKYAPTEVQSLRLKVAQQAAQLAQRDLTDAQKKFQDALSALQQEGQKVKTENHWPADVQFDMNGLSFSEPPTPPKKEEPKK